MKTTKYILTIALALTCAFNTVFAVNKAYYTSVNGKQDSQLREALTTLVYSKHTTNVGYTWDFDDIDIVGGEVQDMYSSCAWTASTDKCGGYSGICDCYNREHVVPQSLFNESLPQKGDRHHLFLTDGRVNQERSSYPFGETDATNGFSGISNSEKALGKLGTSTGNFTGTVYEPDDEYKGDIARAIMYMAIRYATSSECRVGTGTPNTYPVTAWGGQMFSNNLSTNYGLSNAAVAVYMAWHRADQPSATEIARNNGVEALQGNRNPFIDYPELAEYLWGNKKNTAVVLDNLTPTFDSPCSGKWDTPDVTAVAGDRQITLTWEAVTGASSYTVHIGAGEGYTTECSNPTVGTITHEGTSYTCVITGLVNGLSYTTSVVAKGGTTCDSDADMDTTVPSDTPSDVTVTFNANDGSDDPATATQTIPYNTATNLTAINTIGFSRTGYTFQGWATSSSGAKVYNDGASVTFLVNTTLYAVWQANKHSVTFSQPVSGGTFTVNSSSSSPVTNVDFGSTVTIAITPTNSHFTVNTVTVSGGSGSVAVSGSGNTRTFTMPDEDVTVSVTMTEETKYTVNWYVNGTPTAETNYAGEALVGIADPTIDCNGKKFQGWTATENYSSDDTAPTDLFTDASTKTMPSNNNTKYYAVFATETTSGGGSSTVDDAITLDDTGVSGTSYSAWTNLSKTSDAVYAGNNAGGNSAIQLRTNSSNSGIVSTTSGGKIKKVVIAWNSNTTAGRIVDVYGSTSAYTAATNLYATAAQGTLLGSLSYDDDETELTISGDYDYVGLRSHSGALYLNSVTFTWSIGSGSTTTISDYTTSCVAPTEVTVTFHANYEGADPATATQTIPYDTETALTANSFSRTGYTFQGWATSSSGSKEYEDEESVTLTANTHLYAVWQKNSHDVIFTPALTGATVTVNGQSTSPQSVEYGATVTIVIASDAAYDLNSVSATGVSLSGEGNTRTFTMPDDDVTVTVIMTPKPTHIIRFFDNGTNISEQSVVDGQSAVKPTNPTPCDGYAFVGWWTETLAEDNTTAETWVTDFTSTQDQDYYAVFSRTESSGGSSTTESYGFEDTDDASNWEISGVEAYDTYQKTGSKSGKIARSSAGYSTITYKNKVKVTSFSYQFLRQTTNNNYSVYIETSTDKSTWTAVETYAMSSYTSKETWYANSHTFDGETELYVRFNCWTSTAVRWVDDISITYGGGSSTTYYTTSCAPCLTKVTLTKGNETNGSFTLNKADGVYNNCISDFVVTVSGISPDPHYYCTGVTATGENVEVSGPDASGNYTVTYTKGNSITSTITANFAPNPTYAVTWSMDGDESTKVYYEEGDEIEFPTSATGCEDKTFMGWTATAIDAPQDEVPTFVTSATMGTSPITFYAVYAEEDESGSSISSGDYELVESTFSNWAGDYLIAYSDEIFADGRIGGTETGGIGKQYVNVNPGENLSGKVVAGSWGDTYNVTIVESDTEGKYLLKTKDGKYNYHTSNSNGLSATANKTTAEDYPLTITFNSSADIDIAIEAGAVLHYNASGFFRFYQNGSQNNIYLYRKGGGGGINYTNYTTTCGAAISAKNIGWITAAQGQKVKRVINVSAKGFDEATTLSATSGDAQFKVTLGASNVPAGKTGLSTTLTVEYTPTVSDNRVANVEIVLSAGSITKTITVSGRSLPDEFLAVTKKSDTWYALPANMTGGENQYEGVVITPDNDSDPTLVAVAPSTIVYSLHSADNSRYAENGAYVRLAGNGGKALWGNTTANAVTIQNSETVNSANTENYEWSLNTTDGIHYTIANPHHADYASGRVLAFGDKFGLYKTATVFFLVPTGCNSKPLEVNVSARRVDATFSWISNASSVTIDLYTDEEKTAFATSATVTSVPYYMTGLEESTHYWFMLTPDGEDACAVSGEFETTGPTIDVVEWTDESVIVSVDKDDEFHPSIVIDGEVEHGAGTGRVADELFFSKYFEGSGNMKLVAIFNGTKEDIDLTNYSIYIRCRGSSDSWAPSSDVTLYLSSLGTIKSGQEIIFFTRQEGTEALASCSNEFLDDKVTNSSSAESNPRWVECDGNTFKRITFNGNDPIMLYKSSDMIDIIGSQGAAATTKNCRTDNSEKGWSGTAKNMDKGKSPSDPAFDAFYEASSNTPVTTQDSIDLLAAFSINLEDEEIPLTTARCILFRDKRVVSGDSAVLMNETTGTTFITFTNHDSFKSEWTGRSVCMSLTDANKAAAGVTNDAQATCNSYQDLSNFDYSEYYKDWTTIDEEKLDDYIKDPEAGTYEILIPNLAKYSCLNIRFQLKNDAEEVVTEAPVQVPIIVKGGHQTIDAIFNEIMKTDGGDPLYDESIERCQTCNVVVLSDGVLTKATDGSLHDVPEVGNVKVYPGGKLIVPPGTSYSVNSLAFRRQEDEVSTADIQGDLDIKADGNNVYLDLRVDPSEWHYIALPYNCNVADIRFAGDEMKIPILGTDYLLKYYDGEKRAATQAGGCWEMVAPDATLRKGIGYIFGIPGEGKVKREFRFPMSNEIITEEKDPEGKIASGVYAFGGDKSMTEVRANHRGWNLIGDPYLLPYSSDIADPVMTGYIVPDYPEDPEAQWDGHYKFADDARSDLRYIVEPVDNGRSEYIQVPITAYEMKPFTSYFVQIGGSNPEAEQGVQFHLSAVDRSASPVRRAPAEYAEEQEDKHPVWCAVTITSPKGEKDETTMLISDQFTDGYDMMDDLVKMRGTYYQYVQITTKPVLASRNNEGEMAFNALPDASAEAGIPLHYFAATQGEYVLAYSDKYGSEEIQAVMLLDKQLNEWHDLMNEPYTFYTNRTDDKNRFVLTIRVDRRKEPQIATDTDAASSANDRPRKILHNDHIYILRGDRIYDITGKEMLNR